MSSAEEAAKVVRSLEPEDWRVLHALEGAVHAYEYADIEYLERAARLHRNEVEFRLGRLHGLRLVSRRPRGYSLVTAGLDAIALNAFAKRDLISGMGRPIGVGKESDVFEALGDLGEELAVKFFRIGRTSFRMTRRKRQYTSPLRQHHWLVVNIQAAKREYEALMKLWPLGLSVPKPVARERHAILMHRVQGVLLSEYGKLPNPTGVLKAILHQVRRAYVEGGIVNADLSEYNIMYDGEKIWLIDWPQAVDRSHPNSGLLLDRDVRNMLAFFRRRFRIEVPLEEASFYVRGWRESLGVLLE